MAGHLLILFFFLACFAAVTKTKEQDNFYFDPAPMNTDVVDGEEVRLRCDVSNRRLIRFYWTLNNRRLANDSRRFQDDSDLRILRVDRRLDGGSFRCIATNDTTGISVTSTEAKLNILCKYPLLLFMLASCNHMDGIMTEVMVHGVVAASVITAFYTQRDLAPHTFCNLYQLLLFPTSSWVYQP